MDARRIVALATLLAWSARAQPGGLDAPLLADDACTASEDSGSCDLRLLQRLGSKVQELDQQRISEKATVEAGSTQTEEEEEKANQTAEEDQLKESDVEIQRTEDQHDEELDEEEDIPHFKAVPGLSKEQVPMTPPVTLMQFGNPPRGPTLAGGPVTKGTVGLHVKRNTVSFTRRDLAVSDPSGHYVFATSGNFFTLHKRTHVYDAQTGQGLAQITHPPLALHRIYELRSYFPVCPSQSPYETIRGDKLYPFARMTQAMLTMYTSFQVEKYNCDGSLTHLWDIKSRHWFSVKTHYNVYQPGSSTPIGTIDQSHLFQWAANYDAFITAGEDLNLFATASIVADMSLVQTQEDSEKSRADDNNGWGWSSGAPR